MQDNEELINRQNEQEDMTSEAEKAARALSEAAAKKERTNKFLNVLIVVLSVLLALTIVFNLLFKTILVKQTSMEPTIKSETTVLLFKRYGSLSRGDVVVFLDENVYPKKLVKRVIGLPGDEISIDEFGLLTITYQKDGANVTEVYSEPYIKDGANILLKERVIPEGKIFVLGDNRLISFDSEEFGAVDISTVEGVVVLPSCGEMERQK